MKPLIIGQAPARLHLTHKAFDSASGERLAKVMGLRSALNIHYHFECRNLMEFYPIRPLRLGTDTIPGDMAQLAGAEAKGSIVGRVVLLLGRPIAAALGLPWLPWLAWVNVAGAKVALAPHPSATSRWWSQPEAVKGVEKFLRCFVTETQEGENDQCLIKNGGR